MNMKLCALAVLLYFLLLFLLPASPARAMENPYWTGDSRTGFRILLPGRWVVRRHLSPELALRGRSRDGAAYLEVHILREPFPTETEAADGFEELEGFRSLSPVEFWRGTIVSVSGVEGHLRRYRVILEGRPAEASTACFGRGGTWFVVFTAVFPEMADIRAADLEGTLRSFAFGTGHPVPGDPIEGRWRWHNGRILTFGRDGRVAPSSLVSSWRRKPPTPEEAAGAYLLSIPGPAGGEEEAVLSPDGKKLFRISGGERIQIAARLE